MPMQAPEEHREQRQKRPAERQKVRRCADSKTDQQEDPQPSAPDIESQRQKHDRQRQNKQQVEQRRQPRVYAPRCAQQIVIQAEPDPAEHADAELPGLKRERQLHQPSSRRKKLLARSCS